jgi:hypothetical protein
MVKSSHKLVVNIFTKTATKSKGAISIQFEICATNKCAIENLYNKSVT